MNEELHSAPVDLSRIQGLSEGDQAFEREVLEAYLSDCAARLARLAEDLPAGNVENARRDAHTIKGASSNIGTTVLHDIARQLELCDVTAEPEAAAKLLEQAAQEFARVRGYLEGYLSS